MKASAILILALLTFYSCDENRKNAQGSTTLNKTEIAEKQSGSAKIQPSSEEKNVKDVQYDVKITIAEKYIDITYTVKNSSDKSYLVFNYGDTRKGLQKGKVYVEPQKDGTVELSQRMFTAPKGDNSCPARETAVLPGATLLNAGQSISETARVALPLKHDTPFDDCDPKPEMPKEVEKVKFCLGIAEADPKQVKVKDGYVEGWQGVKEQQLLCSKIKEIK